MLFVWALVYKRFFPILLFFPVAIDSYALFLHPGLMWKDIALIAWLLCAIIYVRKIGTLTMLWGAPLIGQISLNLMHVLVGDFQGGLAQIFITPLHMYLPLLVLVLILENRCVDVYRLWSRFNKLILPMAIIMTFMALVAGRFVDDIKQVPGVAASAGFVAVMYPFWVASNSKDKGILTVLGVTIATILFLTLSHTRGALLVCIILAITVVLVTRVTVNARQKLSITIGLGVFTAIFVGGFLFFPSLIPDSVFSIVNLYKGMLFSQGESIAAGQLNMESGEIVRFLLWSHAFSVWINNFAFGLGSTQFDSSRIFEDRDENLSPHHAILSVAVDGGAVAVLFSLLPQLYFLAKTRHGESYEERVIFHFSWLHMAMSFIFGYAFNFIFVIAYYLTYVAYAPQNWTRGWRRI